MFLQHVAIWKKLSSSSCLCRNSFTFSSLCSCRDAIHPLVFLHPAGFFYLFIKKSSDGTQWKMHQTRRLAEVVNHRICFSAAEGVLSLSSHMTNCIYWLSPSQEQLGKERRHSSTCNTSSSDDNSLIRVFVMYERMTVMGIMRGNRPFNRRLLMWLLFSSN